MIGCGINLGNAALARGESSPGIATPTITSPADAAVDVSTSPTVTSSAFAVTNGGSDTHASSDWQAATDAGFSTIVEESLADTTNKTSYDFSGLDPETPHWVRVQHNGTTYGASGWSPAVSFTTAAAPAYDADAQAFITAMGTTPNSAVQDAINDLVVALKATTAGWSGADLIYVPSMPTLADSLLNLRNPATFAMTAVNSPTHTPYAGIAGNGSSSYLNTGWQASVDGVNFTKNNAGLAIGLAGGTDAASNASVAMGAQVASNRATILPWMTANRIGGDINSGSTPSIGTTTISTGSGYTAADRISSSTLKGYRDGVTTGTKSTTSTNMPSNDLLIGCTNVGSPFPTNFINRQIRYVRVGNSMSESDHAAVYAAFEAFVTAMAAAAP